MFDPAPHLSTIYTTLGEPVTPVSGRAFLALFQAADVEVFDGLAQAGDYSLRYASDVASLSVGDVLTIRGTAYRVAQDPQRLGNGLECMVRLRQGVS